MAKVRAPILSARARGQIGKTQVYASWRGVQYARSFVIPRNPRTLAQTTRRDIFAAINDYWKRAASIARGPWTASIVGRPLTARNRIISANLQPLVGELDRQNWTGSPGAAGGIPPTNVTAAATATAGEIKVTVTAPAPPTGWMLASAEAIAFLDGDPILTIPAPLGEAENLAPTAPGDTIVIIPGMTSSQLHVVSAWLRWTKPDGSIAYGASITTTATPL